MDFFLLEMVLVLLHKGTHPFPVLVWCDKCNRFVLFLRLYLISFVMDYCNLSLISSVGLYFGVFMYHVI